MRPNAPVLLSTVLALVVSSCGLGVGRAEPDDAGPGSSSALPVGEADAGLAAPGDAGATDGGPGGAPSMTGLSLSWVKRVGGARDEWVTGLYGRPDGTVVLGGAFLTTALLGQGEPHEQVLATPATGDVGSFAATYTASSGALASAALRLSVHGGMLSDERLTPITYAGAPVGHVVSGTCYGRFSWNGGSSTYNTGQACWFDEHTGDALTSTTGDASTKAMVFWDVGTTAGPMVAGDFEGSMAFKFVSPQLCAPYIGCDHTLTSHGARDLFIQYSRTGGDSWALAAGSPGRDYLVDARAAGDDAVILAEVGGPLTFDGSGASPLRFAGGADGALFKLTRHAPQTSAQYARGTVLWARSFGGSGVDRPSASAVLAGGDVIVLGTFEGAASFGAGEAKSTVLECAATNCPFLARFSGATGDLVWAQRLSSAMRVNALRVAGHDDLVIAGQLDGTATLGEGARQVTLSGHQEVFLARLTSTGAVAWAGTLQGRGADVSALVLTSDDAVILVGQFTAPIAFSDGATAVEFLTSGNRDLYLARVQPRW